MADYAEQVKQVFSNPAGEKLLAMLQEIYGRRISYQPGQTPEETAFREGERNIVQQLEDIANG